MGSPGCLHRAGGLQEQDRELRDGGPALLGVAAIVQADAQEVARLDWGQDFCHLALPDR